MIIPADVVPVCQWNHREFEGVDPWADHREVRWSVVIYRMTSGYRVQAVLGAAQTRGDPSNNVPPKLAVGIYAAAHNRYRVLPLALQEMWRAGQVRDQDLPGLLHQIEGELWSLDYPPEALGVFKGICITLVVSCLVFSSFGLFMGLYFHVWWFPLLLFGVCAAPAGVSLRFVGWLRKRRRAQVERFLALLGGRST